MPVIETPALGSNSIAAIECRGLSKSFGDNKVVNQLNLTINKGECFGLLGPNGAGKSTTIRMMLGHVTPSAGSVQILGEKVNENAHLIRHKVGVVAQFDSLDPDFTVEENLIMYARYFGIHKAAILPELPRLLDFAMLSNRVHANVMALSGGMRRRLSVARALVNHPVLMILDEPTTGLDPQARHLLWDRLKVLKKEGMTVLLTTHFMDEAERLCDRIGIMDKGQLVAQGTPRELIDTTIAAEVIEVFGEDLSQALPQLRALHDDSQKTIRHLEQSGETCFCYVKSPQPLLDKIQALSAQMNICYLHRPANLEDVFLRLTGRDLRDD